MTIPTNPAECRSQLAALADKPELTAAEATLFEDLLEAVERNKVSSLRTRASSVLPPKIGDMRTASKAELRDAAMARRRDAEGRFLAPSISSTKSTPCSAHPAETSTALSIAKRILLTENERSHRLPGRRSPRTCRRSRPKRLRALDEFRAGPMADGTNSLGGYGIPVS